MKHEKLTQPKRRKVKNFDHLEGWRALYKIAALIQIDHFATLIGREQVPYSTRLARDIDERFSYSIKAETDFQKQLIATYVVEILTELYCFLKNGQLDEQSLLYLFLQIIYVDNDYALGRKISAFNIKQSTWKRIKISVQDIRDFHGPKKAALKLVGEAFGISESTISNVAKSDSIAFILSPPPTSSRDLTGFDRTLAESILVNVFHLKKETVETIIDSHLK